MPVSTKKGEVIPRFEFMPFFNEHDGEIKPGMMDYMNIKGGISEDMLAAFHDTSFNTLCISAGNWQGECDFLLQRTPPLTRLTINTDALDWDVVGQLSDLSSLYIGGLYNTKFNLNFSNFNKLKRLAIFWNKGFKDDIYDLPELEKLSIWSWKEKDCAKLARLVNLKHLSLTNCKGIESLVGLEQLKNLETLEIRSSNKLTDISNLLELPNLKQLRIESCKKIHYPENLGSEMNLRAIYLLSCGKVESFKFMQGAEVLEYFATSETTSIDPDIEFIYKLPNIFSARIQQARHYKVNKNYLEKAVNAMYADGYKEEDKQRRLSIIGNRDSY